MINAVRIEFGNIGTIPILSKVLTIALSLWFLREPSSHTPIQMHMDGASHSLRCLLFKQNQIRWDYSFQGQFSQSWWAMQEAFYAQQAPSTESKKRTGSSWHARIIGIIWEHWRYWKCKIMTYMASSNVHRWKERGKTWNAHWQISTNSDLKLNQASNNSSAITSESNPKNHCGTTKIG